MDMTNTLQVSQDDVVAAQRLHARPTYKTLVLILATFPVLCLVGYYLGPEMSLAVAFGGTIGLVVTQGLMFALYVPYRARRMYRQQKSLQRTHEFSWDDQCVFFRSADFEGKLRWADLVKVKKSRSMLLLYHSDTLFNFFPRHCFSSEAQFEEFGSLASEHIRP